MTEADIEEIIINGVTKYKVDDKFFDSLDEAKDYVREKQLQKILEQSQSTHNLVL